VRAVDPAFSGGTSQNHSDVRHESSVQILESPNIQPCSPPDHLQPNYGTVVLSSERYGELVRKIDALAELVRPLCTELLLFRYLRPSDRYGTE